MLYIFLHHVGVRGQAAAASLRLDGSALPGGQPATPEAVVQVSNNKRHA